MNVDKRADGWYATLTVPPDVKDEIGKAKLLRKLLTRSESKGRASQEAAPIVKAWKRDIKKIRDSRANEQSKSDTLKLIEEALKWKEELTAASNNHPNDIHTLVSDALTERLEALESLLGTEASLGFKEVTAGTKTPLEPLYHDWEKSKLSSYSLKTADSYKRDALIFVNKFVYLEAINKRSMKQWISDLMETGTDPQNPKPMTVTTLRDRFMCGVRHFYNYLDTKGLIDEEQVNPMIGVIPKVEKTKINLLNKGWLPMDPSEVSHIYQSIPVDDLQLPAVTAIGMFTGMRIEEVCSLKVSQIITEHGIRCFDIVDSKTQAGIRKIPIHSQLLPLVDRLLEVTKDEAEIAPMDTYLISGLNLNKYDDRANAVGKRFGRLKKSLGYGDKKVYHSIRKCVVTQLDRAGFRETAIADVVGHDNPNMTMGRYSAGSDLATMKEMVEVISYPNLVLN